MDVLRLTQGFALSGLALGLVGCGLLGDGGAELAAQADALVKQGRLPDASDAYKAAAVDHPASVDVAAGAAYTAMLRGDMAGAEAVLAAAEADAGDRLGEVKMRRALVALAAGRLDAVRTHGQASGLPMGKLLAAEVLLADGEREAATGLLNSIKGDAEAGPVAREYLRYLDDPEPLVAGLSEANALWALGEKRIAVRSVEELVRKLPADRQPERRLVWAGRAASVGELEIAQAMIDQGTFGEALAWRHAATQAIIQCAAADIEACTLTFEQLEAQGDVPPLGLADARATAAQLLAQSNPAAAKRLVADISSYAAARALQDAGAPRRAAKASPGGLFKTYLQNGG